MRYSYTLFIFLASVFLNSVTAQVEGWWHTCMSSSPIVQEILINGCGFDAKSEHVLLKTGKIPFDLKNYHLKVSVANGHTPLGEVIVQPNSSNVTAINYLNNAYKGCYFGDVFVDAQSQQYSGIIPPESALLIFNDKNNTDVYYLNDAILKNWCSSKIFIAFGTVLNNVAGKSLFENYIYSSQCTNMCLRQIDINFDANNSFCEKIIYDVSKLPHSQSNPPTAEGKGSYIVPKNNSGIDYLGGQLYGLNSCVPEKLFDNSDCVNAPINYSFKVTPINIGTEKNWRVMLDTSNVISPLKIKWSGSSVVNRMDSTTVTLSEGNYTLQLSDGRTCSTAQSFNLGNAAAFVVKISGTDSVCIGGMDDLVAQISGGTNPIVVDWFDSAGNSVQKNNLFYSLTITASTFFVAQATDANGLIVLDTFKIFCRPYLIPKVKMGLNTSTIICNGQVVTFNASGAKTYVWSGTPNIASDGLNTKTGDTVKLFSLYLPAPGCIISVVGTDSLGCSTKVDTAIKVIPLPVATIAPVSDTICSTDAPFKIIGTAEVGLAVDKYSASCGACIVGNTFYPKLASVGKNLVVHDTENSSGCKNSPSIIINVKVCTCTTPPIIVAGSDISVCKNQSINLNGSSQFAQSTLWSSTGSGSFTDSSNVKTLYTPSANDSIRGAIKIYLASVKPTVPGCKNATDSLVLKFGTNSAVTIPATSCNLADVGTKVATFKNQNGCDSIVTTVTTFAKSDSIFIPATSCNIADIGSKVLKLKNRNGCDSIVTTRTTFSKSDSTFFNTNTCDFSQAGTTILKFISSSGCDSIVTTKKIFHTSDTTYKVLQTCLKSKTGSDTARLKNAFGCDSLVVTKTTLAQQDTTQSKTFTCSASEVGVFLKTLKSISGCDSIVQTTVQLKNSTVGFGLKVVKKITCNAGNDGAIGLTDRRGGTPPYSVQWGNSYNTDTIKNLQAGFYSVTLTDAKGCVFSDSITLQQPVSISANFNVIPPLCYPDASGTIILNTISNAALPIKIILLNINYDSIKTPYTFKNISVGTSNFSFIDKNKCRFDTTVNIPTAPIRQFSLGSDIRIALGDSANIGAAINFFPQNIKWSPLTGLNCDSCLNPIAKPVVSTQYNVVLKDSLGCTLTNNITVYIDKRRSVFIPNSFSPNGDNINDVFTPFADQTVDKINEFSVFNRWGEKVYSLQNYKLDGENIGWHGDYKGVYASVGVYTFFVNVLYKDGKTETMQGEVTLVR